MHMRMARRTDIPRTPAGVQPWQRWQQRWQQRQQRRRRGSSYAAVAAVMQQWQQRQRWRSSGSSGVTSYAGGAGGAGADPGHSSGAGADAANPRVSTFLRRNVYGELDHSMAEQRLEDVRDKFDLLIIPQVRQYSMCVCVACCVCVLCVSRGGAWGCLTGNLLCHRACLLHFPGSTSTWCN